MASEIGVGVIGLGFMGSTHVKAYQAAAKAGRNCRLVAVCDVKPDRRTGAPPGTGNIEVARAESRLFDPASVHVHETPEAMLADPDVRMVSICTHTDSHVDLAVKALAAGKHVLVEKPVARKTDDIRRLLDAMKSAKTLCMPAMCMRFWPGWTWLKEQIDKRTYGETLSATFQRIGAPPTWAPEFYRNAERCGGALVDLHVHDVDFIRWCFGDPSAVIGTGEINHVTGIFFYDDNPRQVVAHGGWIDAEGMAFRMRYLVAFEHAAADFDLTRDPQLLLTHGGKTEPVKLEPSDAYQSEIEHLLDAVTHGKTDTRATIAEAEAVARLLEAEQESLTTRNVIHL